MSTDVLTVSLRDFQHNANEYIGKSIILTRYNIPIARVEPIGEKILEKKIVEPVIKEVPSEKSSERHVCSWDKGFNCKSPGTLFVKGKWWCTPHGLEV